MHHNKLEVECKQEKNLLIKLLGKYRKLISKCKNKNIFKNLESSKKYQELKETYNDIIKNKIIDHEFFFSIMGDSLENIE